MLLKIVQAQQKVLNEDNGRKKCGQVRYTK